MSKGNPPVTRQKPMKADRSFIIGAFDTETHGLDGKLVLTQVYMEGWQEAEVFSGVADLINKIFKLPTKILKKAIWYAHNAEYDWRYIYSAIGEMGYNIVPRERAKGKFYELRIVSQTEFTKSGEPVLITRFRDSMAFFPFSLAEFTKSFAPDNIKQDIGLGSGVMFDPSNVVHIAYAKNDVIGLVNAIRRFDELIYENFTVHLAATASSTAYQAWLRFAPEGEYHDRQNPETEKFLRKAYHGGLVGLNAAPGQEYPLVNTFDINSSYPANMRLGVPKGKARWTYKFHEGFPGFYRTTATVPDNAILPIVPFRSDNGQLAWRTGVFESYLSSIEIEYCQTLGATFEIHEGVYFPDGLTHCFDDFVDVCERLRTEFKGTPTEIVVKLMQNSLYGRFGMRPDGRECVIDFEGQPDDMEAVFTRENVTVKDAYYKDVIRDASYMLPHYSAWITANARILIDKGTEAAGREFVLYRDTDSVHTIGLVENLAAMTGKRYGDFKLEKPKTRVIYHAPKCYTYTDDAGELQAVYKGIPRNLVKIPDKSDKKFAAKYRDRNELISKLHDGEHFEVKYHSSSSMQTFMKSGKFFVMRSRTPTDPNQVYGHIIENGKFRPRRTA